MNYFGRQAMLIGVEHLEIKNSKFDFDISMATIFQGWWTKLFKQRCLK